MRTSSRTSSSRTISSYHAHAPAHCRSPFSTRRPYPPEPLPDVGVNPERGPEKLEEMTSDDLEVLERERRVPRVVPC